jgi:hypothetical protein
MSDTGELTKETKTVKLALEQTNCEADLGATNFRPINKAVSLDKWLLQYKCST